MAGRSEDCGCGRREGGDVGGEGESEGGSGYEGGEEGEEEEEVHGGLLSLLWWREMDEGRKGGGVCFDGASGWGTLV